MSSKQMKKKESANRLNSAQGGSPTKELTSSMNHTSPLNASFEQKGKFTMWPEWSDADINSEKWDSGKVLKDKDKSGKSAALYFDDPEGKIDLPSNLKINSWKRPHEFITSALPVVVKDENSFDLMSRNEHLFGSELMRWIISEISAVWRIYNTNLTPNKLTAVEPSVLVWKPWEHIYALCKVTKGHMPLYNSYGKYVVKLYWMGCWRKIIVDDAIPFNEENLLLLPVTTCETELWPLLLSKAIIKIANADTKGFAKRELGEFTVIHALTGWLPEVLPLENYYINKVWDFLKATVPEFKHPDDEQPEPKDLSPEQNSKEIKKAGFETEIPVPVILKSSEKTSKEKTEAKETGKKKADKEKIRSAPHSARPPSDLPASSQPLLRETSSLSQNPQTIVYASYLPLHLNEKKITVLGQMADSSEKLRQYGLPHILSHPVLVTRTRSCPLVAPPKPIPIPRWKLIRPQRAVNITDEPKEPVQKKPDQFVEITTPFLNFQLDPTDISTEKLSHMASHLKSVSEDEENIQESDIDLKEIPRVSATESATEIATAEDHRSPGENIEGEIGGENVPQDTLATDVTSQPCPLENPPEEKSLETNPVSKDIWMYFSDFCKCFQTLYVFHKPKTYPYTYQKSNFKPSTNGELYYLCVDNLKSTEILVSFSALVRWGETASENESASQNGLLFAEKFSWKSISTGHFVLRISTDLTKAAMIRLPPGRHLLRFTATSPLGYHIHLCSTVPFVFGDEETVMPHLEKESYRFVEQASRIVRAILNVMIHFNNKEELPKAVKELDLTVCSQGTKLRLGKAKEHYEIFNKALWHLITEVMGNKVTLDFVLAYRAFTLDFSSLTSTQTSLPTDPKHEVPITWQNRSATSLEEAAAVKLQACLKGSYVRKLWHSRKPDNRENTIIRMTLDKLVNLLEPNAEQFGASLLRYLIKHSPASRELYACCNDEPYRISYMDYTVSYPEQPPNTWFVVFREVFHMPEDMILTPVIFSTIPVCNLYVINNDTLKEIPWVFTKVPPYVYTKNIRGYTFMAQAYTGETYLVPGKFKLRLIGDHKPLPFLSRENPNNSFTAKETKGFYIPNGDNVIFRYTVKAAIDHMATVQVQTSKPDVFIKVQIMDNGEELLSVTGKGRALIPAFCFFTNERPLSSSSSRSQLLLNGSKKGRITSGGSLKNNKTSSRPESKLDVHCAETESLEEKIQHQLHKYIIQATVLNDSWKLTESQAAFVESLRESEKQESQVFGEKQEGIVADINNGDDSKSINTPKTARKGKEKPVEKSGKDKVSSAPNSRPASQDQANHSDPSKPLWFLQLTSETNEAGTLEAKKDTARIDEIKSMKQAWELADPGRAVKALQSRLQYINKNMQKVLSPPASETDDSQGDPIANGERTENIFQPATVTTSNINLPFSQRELEPMDLTPLIRRNSSETAVRDEAFIQQQAVRKAEEIKEWQALREQMLVLREQAQVVRNFLKNEFLQKYEDLQLSLDNAREEIFRIREAYRSQLLESDRQKQEALLAEEAALKAVQEKVTPSGQKRKSGKGSKK